MKKLITIVIGSLALASIHCTETSTPSSKTSSVTEPDQAQPVVLKGDHDKGDPAVVLMSSGHLICTGTVIAPTYVLTAAHCVRAVGDLRSHPVHVNGIAVVALHAPDGALEETESNDYRHDVAVLQLAKPISITPIPVNLDAHALTGVDRIRTVGFGLSGTHREDSGVKRDGVSRISRRDFFLDSGPGAGGICYGDSGGPALADIDGRETIIGVASHVVSKECERGGVFTRTDRQREFLARFVDATPMREPDRIARKDPPPPPRYQQENDDDTTPQPQQQHRHHSRHHSRQQQWWSHNEQPPPMFDNGTMRVSIDSNGTLVVVQDGRTIRTGPEGVQID